MSDHEGERLTLRPATVTTWQEFREALPEGMVLQPPGDGDACARSPRNRYEMAPYEQYVSGDHFGLYGMRGTGDPRSWERSDIDAKTVVPGVERGDEAVGYPIPTVEASGGVVTDTVGGQDIHGPRSSYQGSESQ